MTGLLATRSRVLAIGAHPDDIEVGAGGLLARYAAEGADVTMAVVSVPPGHAALDRAAEAQRGAEIIGARLVILHAESRCRVEDIPMHELVRRLDMLVGDVRPDLVITHAEQDLHWDHGLVHRATLSALRRTPCDLLTYMSSPEMNAHARPVGQCFADISTTIETKLRAIAAHASQMPRMDLESSRDMARGLGRLSGVQFAEAYQVMRVRL